VNGWKPAEKEMKAIISIIEGLKDLSTGEVILVEGYKDRLTLHKLDVKSDIYVINNGKSAVENSEIIARKYSRVIILTDWDRTGGRLTRLFKEQLGALGIECSLKEREKLAVLCKKGIKDVESLYKYVGLYLDERLPVCSFSGFPQ
jgi:5S rRNA maturation endonuclease (ribonuclease M5)